MSQYHDPSGKIFRSHKGRDVIVIHKVADRLHYLPGTGFGEIVTPASANAGGAKAQVFAVINLA